MSALGPPGAQLNPEEADNFEDVSVSSYVLEHTPIMMLLLTLCIDREGEQFALEGPCARKPTDGNTSNSR